MLADQRFLFRREPSRFLQYHVGDADLADIVQQRAHANQFVLRLRNAHRPGDRAGVIAHPQAVAGGVRIPGVMLALASELTNSTYAPTRRSCPSRMEAAALLKLSVSSRISRTPRLAVGNSGRTPVLLLSQ